MGGCRRPLPGNHQRHQRETKADETGAASADPVPEHAEDRPEQGAAQQRDGDEQALLRGREAQLLAQERRERAEQHPRHEADVEVQQRRDQRRQVAATEEPFGTSGHAAWSASTGLDGERQLDEHDARLDPGGIAAHALAHAGRPHDCTGAQADLPGMERTDNRAVGDDPVGQRSSLVRTAVVDRCESISKIEDGDLAPADESGTALTHRDAVGRGDPYPSFVVHMSPCSIGCNGMNCVGCTGCAPSCHASRDRAFDFRRRSSSRRRTLSGAYTVSFRIRSIPTRSTKS